MTHTSHLDDTHQEYFNTAMQQIESSQAVSALPELVESILKQANRYSQQTGQTDDYDDQVWALFSLSSNASEKIKSQIEAHILNTVLPNLPEHDHAGVYMQLGGHENHTKATAMIEHIRDPYIKAHTLIQLDHVDDAYRMIDKIDDIWKKSVILRTLLSKNNDLLQEFLDTAEKIEEPYWRASTLGYSLGRLPEDQHPQIIDRVLPIIPNIKSPRPRIQAIMSIYEMLPEHQQLVFQREIMSTIRQLTNEYSIHGLMQHLGRAFEGEARTELIEISQNLTDPLYRARSMFIFLPDTDAASIKRDIVTYLTNITNHTRGQVISLFARREILSPDLWSQDVADQTIGAIIESVVIDK